ncbi:MAG: cell division protein FtsX [Gammaproteobacteria bacterium]|nr:MAG: cell division protein FtsX [Gammaproteobacteria bacterium]
MDRPGNRDTNTKVNSSARRGASDRPNERAAGSVDSASAVSRRGASNRQVAWRDQISVYFDQHRIVISDTLDRLWSTPVSTLMTMAVVAVAIALPSGLYVLLANVQQVAKSWDGNAQVSLFLKDSVDQTAAQKLLKRIALEPHISRTEYISKADALLEFEEVSGYSALLSEFEDNPLPSVIVVYLDSPALAVAEQFKAQASEWQAVQLAQLDAQWVRKLQSLVSLAKNIVAALAVGLALAVFLVVINTIRLAIENKKSEVEIYQLVGATNGFIRRPFLYIGAWFGLSGGIVAIFSVELLLVSLQASVTDLATQYQSQYLIQGMDFQTVLFILFASALLGLSGAWIAVARHLSNFEFLAIK